MDKYEDFVIPVYIIRQSEGELIEVKKQFKDRFEFEINLIESCKYNGEISFWESVLKVIRLAIKRLDHVIIICKENHRFTEEYTKSFLFDNIIAAADKGVNLLMGGVNHFGQAVPLSRSLFWVDHFGDSQFIIIYRNFFEKILEEPFDHDDFFISKISRMTSHKMVLFPFVSIERFFDNSKSLSGRYYSEEIVHNTFESTTVKINRIYNSWSKYNSRLLIE